MNPDSRLRRTCNKYHTCLSAAVFFFYGLLITCILSIRRKRCFAYREREFRESLRTTKRSDISFPRDAASSFLLSLTSLLERMRGSSSSSDRMFVQKVSREHPYAERSSRTIKEEIRERRRRNGKGEKGREEANCERLT